MNHFTETDKIKEIDHKMLTVKHSLEGILQIFNTVDRKRKSLETQLHILEQERQKLSQGQLFFDYDF